MAAVIAFTHDDKAVELANATPYGLGASVWTRRGTGTIGHAIGAGAFFINGNVASDPRLPFGGVKKSGYGRELGEAGATESTNIRRVLVG